MSARRRRSARAVHPESRGSIRKQHLAGRQHQHPSDKRRDIFESHARRWHRGNCVRYGVEIKELRWPTERAAEFDWLRGLRLRGTVRNMHLSVGIDADDYRADRNADPPYGPTRHKVVGRGNSRNDWRSGRNVASRVDGGGTSIRGKEDMTIWQDGRR